MSSMTEILIGESPRELICNNILKVLRERLKLGNEIYFQEVVRVDTESGTSGHPVEYIDIFAGPLSPVYEPERLQALTSILTTGLTISRESRADSIPLGLNLARVQLIEDCEDKKQVITLIMLPQAKYAKICADYLQAWTNRIHPYIADISELAWNIRHEIIEQFRNREHDLEEWASRLIKGKNETGNSES
ncbi:MAG: hypothetical protein G01um10145_217 [Microgenomates group bacterium Gr01-1014_5]|nr:MAG: hypothetical protein G01um10145_217 [Microgenomates group bacterium Gr01-1014_5]